MAEQRVCECEYGYPECEYCKFHRAVGQQRRTGRARKPCGHFDLTPGCEDCYPGWKKIARLIGSCGEVVREAPYNGCSRWEVPMLNGEASRTFLRGAPRQPMHENDKQQTVVLYYEEVVHPACMKMHSLVCDNVAKQLEDWKSLYAQTEMRVQELEKELVAVRGSNCEAPQMAELRQELAAEKARNAQLEELVRKLEGSPTRWFERYEPSAVAASAAVKRREPMVIRCQGEED